MVPPPIRIAVLLFLAVIVITVPISKVEAMDRVPIKERFSSHRTTYIPLVTIAPDGLSVQPQNRVASIAFFHTYYTSPFVPVEWSGNHDQCHAGSTSAAFREVVVPRINYFRAMAGVPAVIQLRDDYSAKAQQAALMMSVNRRLSHTPNPDWHCYTEAGNEGAASSNLFLGRYGVDAITGYIADGGSSNYPVGHRRWILYPQTRFMGSGDIPSQNGYPAANALWLFDKNLFEARPATREPFVAWPPAGYVPYQVVFPRWSFSYPDADFANTTVSMTLEGQPIGLTVQPIVNGFGENTMTWEPVIPIGTPPLTDLRYTVTVHNVGIGGSSQTFSYDVVVIDPDL